MRTTSTISGAIAAAVLIGAAAATSVGSAPKGGDQHSRLLDRQVLPASTVRAGSPPTGAFFTATNRADAAGNGVVDSDPGPAYLANQPVQGFSAMVPAGDGTWWTLTDNGFGARESSGDYQLAIYRIDPNFGESTPPEVRSSILLRDPDRRVPWQLMCDRTGTPLPDLSINVLPATLPPACGSDPAARLLTGFDFDPESMQIGRDGTLWIGEEFGPFLLHADATGKLLEPPIATPGIKAPQNPTLDLAHGERPNVATSRGFEGLAVSPDRRTLYPLLEGAVGDDHPQDVIILTFDIRRHVFTDEVHRIRLEMPGAKVNLTTLLRPDGSPAYAGATAPVGTGGQAHGELTAINDHQFLFVERDSGGDGTAAPRFKKMFLLDSRDARRNDGYVSKRLLVDLLAIPDPDKVGGDGDYFRFPFVTIESVHPIDDHRILVASDNNFPFSNGRSRSLSADRTGPLFPDDNEIILIELGERLDVDRRILTPER